jgi:hypothetical protein
MNRARFIQENSVDVGEGTRPGGSAPPNAAANEPKAMSVKADNNPDRAQPKP